MRWLAKQGTRVSSSSMAGRSRLLQLEQRTAACGGAGSKPKFPYDASLKVRFTYITNPPPPLLFLL